MVRRRKTLKASRHEHAEDDTTNIDERNQTDVISPSDNTIGILRAPPSDGASESILDSSVYTDTEADRGDQYDTPISAMWEAGSPNNSATESEADTTPEKMFESIQRDLGMGPVAASFGSSPSTRHYDTPDTMHL